MQQSFTIRKPNLPTNLPESPFHASQSEPELNNVLIHDCTVSSEMIERLTADQVIFKNVIFDEVIFPLAEFTDCYFDHCDLSNADLNGSLIHRVHFSDCKLLGADFSEATFGNVHFDACIMKWSAFGFSRLKHVSFDSCVLDGGDFYECLLQKTIFHHNDLNEANFGNTPLKGIDLRTNTFQRLQITLPELEGCMVTSEQAIGFARLLGLQISDD